FAGFELDEDRFELRYRNERIGAQPKVLRLLFHLIAHRHRVVPSEELLRVLWPDQKVTLASVRRAVRGARRALEGGADPSEIIRAVTGMGSQFVAPVSERDLSPAPMPVPVPVPVPVPAPAPDEPRRERATTERPRAPMDSSAPALLDDVFVGREAELTLLE